MAELQFFVPSLLDGDINVHALDGQKNAYEGLWYAVLSRDCAYHAEVMQAHRCPRLLDNSFALLIKVYTKLGLCILWVFH